MRLIHTLYEPAGEGPHPTLIAMHGFGASALDLLGLAPLLYRRRPLHGDLSAGSDGSANRSDPRLRMVPDFGRRDARSRRNRRRYKMVTEFLNEAAEKNIRSIAKNWWCSASARAA